jgi:hypothetical protein
MSPEQADARCREAAGAGLSGTSSWLRWTRWGSPEQSGWRISRCPGCGGKLQSGWTYARQHDGEALGLLDSSLERLAPPRGLPKQVPEQRSGAEVALLQLVRVDLKSPGSAAGTGRQEQRGHATTFQRGINSVVERLGGPAPDAGPLMAVAWAIE